MFYILNNLLLKKVIFFLFLCFVIFYMICRIVNGRFLVFFVIVVEIKDGVYILECLCFVIFGDLEGIMVRDMW